MIRHVHTLNTLLLAVLWLWPMPAAAQGTVIPFVSQQFLDASGNECNGCLLDTYVGGTSTPLATYSESTLTTANANPVVMDSSGRPTTGAIYLSATSYNFRLRTSAGAVLWTVGPVTAIPTSSGNVDVTGTAGEALTAGNLAFLSDGSGGQTAGRWYQADADNTYSSTTPQIGFVPTAISSATSGTIRVAGRITGLSGLTAGTVYYVSATAAGVTSTAPSNSRRVGQADSTTTMVFDANPAQSAAVVALGIVEGRLTGTTAVPVTTADVTGATSIFYTPYKGNRISLYDGTNWNIRTFTEITLALTCTASLPYDVFAYDNATVVTLETLAWTNATTRATALALQNGVLSKTGALTRRYIGSFYCNSSANQTDDSLAKRNLFNYYNRVTRAGYVTDATASWTYTTAAFRQANGSTANQIEIMVGVVEDAIDVRAQAEADNSANNADAQVGIGQSSTTTPITASFVGRGNLLGAVAAGNQTTLLATYAGLPALGRQTYVWLEYSEAVGTTTWRATSQRGGIMTMSRQ